MYVMHIECLVLTVQYRYIHVYIVSVSEPKLICIIHGPLSQDYSSNFINNIPYIIGGTLADMLKDSDGYEYPLSIDQSLYYLYMILKGIEFLHENGVIHLNINCKQYYFLRWLRETRVT